MERGEEGEGGRKGGRRKGKRGGEGGKEVRKCFTASVN